MMNRHTIGCPPIRWSDPKQHRDAVTIINDCARVQREQYAADVARQAEERVKTQGEP